MVFDWFYNSRRSLRRRLDLASVASRHLVGIPYFITSASFIDFYYFPFSNKLLRHVLYILILNFNTLQQVFFCGLSAASKYLYVNFAACFSFELLVSMYFQSIENLLLINYLILFLRIEPITTASDVWRASRSWIIAA